MNTKTGLIHCTFREDGKALADMIQESFRMFLRKELSQLSAATHDGES